MDILNHFDHYGKKQDKEHFMNLIKVALSDGIIDQSESQILHRMGKKMGFTDPEIDSLIDSTSKTEFIPPYKLSKRFEQVYDIIKIVLADGVIDSNEMRIANAFAIKLGFTEIEMPGLLSTLIKGIREGKDEDDLFELYKKERKH
ncbi:MAG: hypothetical protein CVU05_05960 [Bacteroidetes bacterium HGW-Bacteroidetes-21]|jgi:tellurite resistance protein|nr:MAG: hypothetical protein CVU05_05960 [Bacteroidetes bacterium HGW-Bacteroidetes-21]